jgi:hypothetical protein
MRRHVGSALGVLRSGIMSSRRVSCIVAKFIVRLVGPAETQPSVGHSQFLTQPLEVVPQVRVEPAQFIHALGEHIFVFFTLNDLNGNTKW